MSSFYWYLYSIIRTPLVYTTMLFLFSVNTCAAWFGVSQFLRSNFHDRKYCNKLCTQTAVAFVDIVHPPLLHTQLFAEMTPPTLNKNGHLATTMVA